MVIETLLLAIGLSMDAFAVAICKGLAMQKANIRSAAIVGLWFGGFQALMPTVGYLIGKQFEKYIDTFDHWIAFVLLCLIGVNMIREAFSKEEEDVQCSLAFKVMFVMAVATSIDAMAAGISLSMSERILPIYIIVSIIGVTTCLFSMAGVKIGSVFGTKYKSKAEFCGGLILCGLGIKMLLEGLSII